MDDRDDVPRVRVVFRYDDCSAKSSLRLEEQLAAAFGEFNLQITLGVIPFVCEGDWHESAPQELLPLQASKVAFLREAARKGHIELALHGWSHQLWDVYDKGEFCGLPLSEQRRRIASGHAELTSKFDCSINTFIPPWNAYDENTLLALSECGIRCVSASLRGPFPNRTDHTFIPFSCWYKGVPHVIRHAASFRRRSAVLVIMLHDFDFVESGLPNAWLTINELRARLKWLIELPDIAVCSVGQAATAGICFGTSQLQAARRWRSRTRRLPWRIKYLVEDQVLWADKPDSRKTGSARYTMRQGYVSCQRVARDLGAAAGRKFRRLFRTGLSPTID